MKLRKQFHNWHKKFENFYFLYLRKFVKDNWFEYLCNCLYIFAEADPHFPDSIHLVLGIIVHLP